MALDHFVSQVHLRNFYSPELSGKKMYGVQKSTLKCFPCGAEDVCRIEEGSTNLYLTDTRAIEDFLRDIEPFYNKAVGNIRIGNIDANSIFVIAGFVSYIMSCSPTAMRLNSEWFAKMVESTAAAMDAAGRLPPPPKELGATSVSELLRDGTISASVDGKLPQAIGIAGIMDCTSSLGNADWDILINDELDSPFFTSDFPVAIERSPDPRILNRIVPLAPDIAIRIWPKFEKPDEDDALNFPLFRSRLERIKPKAVRKINQLIVQCAEDQVYYRDDHPWVLPFIKKHAAYWIEPITKRHPGERGELIWSSMRIAPRK